MDSVWPLLARREMAVAVRRHFAAVLELKLVRIHRFVLWALLAARMRCFVVEVLALGQMPVSLVQALMVVRMLMPLVQALIVVRMLMSADRMLKVVRKPSSDLALRVDRKRCFVEKVLMAGQTRTEAADPNRKAVQKHSFVAGLGPMPDQSLLLAGQLAQMELVALD